MGWQGRGKRTTYSRVQGHDAAEETEARFARGKLCHESHDLIASKKSSDDESDWPETADALSPPLVENPVPLHEFIDETLLLFSEIRSSLLVIQLRTQSGLRPIPFSHLKDMLEDALSMSQHVLGRILYLA